MIDGWNLIYGGSGYTVDPQGFLYQIISPGTTHPTTADTISVTYTGKLMNNVTFDSSASPISFLLSGLILGWQYALPLVGVGGQIRFIVPASFAYGCDAIGSIPANSPLDFTVNLISIVPPPSSTPTPTPTRTPILTPTNTPSPTHTPTTTCVPGTYATQSTEMINGWNLIYGSSGYTVDPQGFLYQIMSSGTTHPTTANTVSVTYTGKTMNGTTFDSTASPISFPLSGTILGWQYALPLIGVGGQIRFIIPASLGYGCSAAGSIPANSPTDYTVNLISVT
jgi:FKBP-type peptidyl-prolyl cis-trans isomerase